MGEVGWRIRLVVGIALAAIAALAVRVDIINNYSYGVTISEELATVMVLAALCVIVLPVVASLTHWNAFLRTSTALFVALTVWAAANAYSNKQGANIRAAEGAQQRYEDAQKDAETARKEAADARKEAAVITETGSASELADMIKQAQVKVDGLTSRAADIGRACALYKPCNEADSDLRILRDRLGKAKSKEEALARAKEADAKVKQAKGEAKDGPAEASMLATVIAKLLKLDAADIARHFAVALTILSIIGTQCAALLGGKAAGLIAGALKIRAQEASQRPAKPVRRPRPEGVSPKGRKKSAPKSKPGSNVVRFDSAKKKSVEHWLDSSTSGWGEMRQGDALKAYKRAGERITADEFQAIIIEILGKEAVVKRASGYVIVGRSLRAAGNLKLAVSNS